ncbi:MAG: Gfo/Idh/MocA family oxidoreductase [Planctomycetes bacterium]|nr:Gfo/Idh/MocA family oxidoreductase [Planctomycetota bacterium]
MPDINIALIGAGFMGKAHSNAWRQVSAFCAPRLTPRLKEICGLERRQVRAMARAYGWETATTDWRPVIARPDTDLVDICTPGDSHAEIAIAAARAGKIVLCEKPLANSIRDAERMLAAVERAGVPHMISHNYRRVPAVALAGQIIKEGRIGKIRHFRGTYLQDWITDPAFPLVWRLDRKQAGSGALGDIASHAIDLARMLVGEIAEVAGATETFIKTRPLPGAPRRRGRVTVDDAVVAAVRFANGAIGSIEATRLAPGRKNYNRFEINGSLGSLAFNLERLNELEVYFESDPPSLRGFRTVLVTEKTHPHMAAWWPPGHIIGWEHTFTHTVYSLLEAVASKRVPSPSFHDGVMNQRVLDAIERSSRTRRWVRVKGVA